MRHVACLRSAVIGSFGLWLGVFAGCGSSGSPGNPDASDAAGSITCGDGVVGSGETCDPSLPSASDPRLRCGCDDGSPCTLDRCAAGTSAEDCTCECEHVPQADVLGVGTCDDDDACTVDVTTCADPNDTRSAEECAAACAITCDSSEVVVICQDICGNGVINGDETCEVIIPEVSPAETPACGCDDGDPCTLDAEASGSAAECDLVCSHTVYGDDVYGVTSCDDGLACTADTLVAGSAETCDVSCQHDPIEGWETAACSDGDACTQDVVTSSDASTCFVTCDNPPHTGYPYPPSPGSGALACDDGIACTTDVVGPLDPATCQYLCTHTGLSGYENTHCDDGNACTVDTIASGSPATCNVACSHRDTRGDADVPDLDATFDDTNCDGVDGNAAQMVFVAVSGNDTSGTGRPQAPYRTIARGISAAMTLGFANVAVSLGLYDRPVVLANGVSIHGGYNAESGWSRSATNATVIRVSPEFISGGRVEGLIASGITMNTIVSRFTIIAGAPSTPPPLSGVSVYGVRITQSTYASNVGLQLHHLQVTAGRASNGAMGMAGSFGQRGADGRSATGRARGEGGFVWCDQARNEYSQGGWGGWGGYDGTAATCLGTTTAGEAGSAAGGYSCNGGHGGDSADGCGTDGSNVGGDGSWCGNSAQVGYGGSTSGNRGRVQNGEWVPAASFGGGRGGHGAGGSGGGGGGSGNCDTVCSGPEGGGGAGAPSGGCGGYPGGAGSGAGSSFGLFAVDSSFLVVGSTFVSGVGGSGGQGGAGGYGGSAGLNVGQPGGGSCPDPTLAINPRCSSRGGYAGYGRDGARGGGGASGASGNSVAQLLCRSAAVGVSPSSGTAGWAAGSTVGGAPNGDPGIAGISSPLQSLSGACVL